MKLPKSFRLQFRAMQAALVLMLALLLTAAVSTHQLLLDATNKPTTDVSLSSTHWTDTLNDAQLSANVLRVGGDGVVTIPGSQLQILAPGGSEFIAVDSSAPVSTSNGGSIDTSNGGRIRTSFGGSITTNDGGNIATDSGGGYIATNGFGAPTDNAAPIGSLYCDQDPSGDSGHVLWVMEPSGWVGK